ncbi:class A beta-lactamase-related serine hydrolase [Flaviaesturariibacter flavus]|uniref:Class A beta-lactamase-related serine hydrolase n=1 Tax=Flaviaesturariibacter flavus TaxID=2502780 RepID=A0A4V2NV80_9BACT|nr:serine hydrolase domain-containing protein [Flaviaesturariibacter flavus]TCJ12446.1 class A beta-lactamase-related serine hydrolase [Flaviaesturariibacter flavus]
MTLSIQSNCLKVSILAGSLLFLQPVLAQQMDTASLSAFMEQKVRSLKNNNQTLAVASKDTIIYKNDIKTFNVVRGQGEAGYISEFFTTVLALMMADEGKFSLDDKVAQYLPEFAKYGKNYITIRHCLTHMSGIQVPSKPELFERGKFESLEQEANKYASYEIQTNPGTETRFSERGYAIVARLIEATNKGKKFDNLMQQRIFRPLGMRGTTFQTLDGSLPSPVFGARSTSGDLVQFGRMLLNGGTLNGVTCLKPESVDELRKISTEAASFKGAPKGMERYDYAMGAWATESTGGKASALVVPSFGGTALLIDFCRGYTAAYLLKTREPKAEAIAEIKAYLEGGVEIHCK